MTSNQKGWVTATVTFLLLTFGGLVYTQNKALANAVFQQGVAQVAQQEAEDWKKKAIAAEDERDAARGAADSFSFVAAQQTKEVERLKALIPKKVPPPATDPELQATLVASGLRSGLLVVHEEGPSRLARMDAEAIYAWQQSDAMVPSLKATLGAAEARDVTRIQEIAALRLANTFCVEGSDAWKAAHDKQKDRADALDKSVKSLTTAKKVDWWVTAGKVTGALAVGYLTGRALK